LEARLAATWAELLDVDTVSIDAGFFELGGHSLLAVRLVRRLSRELGRDVPLSLLFTAPTVGHMAEALRESDGQRAMLVPLRGEGEGEPLFCIHPIDGEVVVFRELAQCLEPGRPIVGVQDPHRAEPGQGATSIEAMAASYLESIRRVQPRGPYHLLGYSFGGVVAFDMARQLGEQGDAVALLALVDTLPPALSIRQSGGLVTAGADDIELLSSMLGDTMGPAARDDLAACMDASPADPWAAAVRWLHGRGLIDADVDAARLTADLDILRRRRRLLAAYRPPTGSQRLDQSMVFFRAVDEHGEGRERTALGWVDHVEPEPLDVPIEGDHRSVLAAPGAALIAAHLVGRFADGS
ncbi:MAG: thioesterase domain-containing protein, partial [Acidobacteriota bacterium]